MQDNYKRIKKWLQDYDIPPIPEESMEELVGIGKDYMESSVVNTSSFRNVLKSQLQCLTPAFWTIQIVLMSVAIVMVLLGVREISKSNIYAMWEIEQSSRYPLVKIVSCRMLIIGLFHLFFMTGILTVMSYYYQQSMIGMILYGMVPFNLSCTCYLFVTSKNGEENTSYYLIVSMVCLIVVFFFISRQRLLFQSSMLWGWCIFYLLSLMSAGKAVKTYLKYEKMIGEWEWNLQ